MKLRQCKNKLAFPTMFNLKSINLYQAFMWIIPIQKLIYITDINTNRTRLLSSDFFDAGITPYLTPFALGLTRLML